MKQYPFCEESLAMIYTLPALIIPVVSVLLPCYTLWNQRQFIGSHPEVVALLPILLAHAALMALGIWQALERAKKRRRSWPQRMRYHLTYSTFGSIPFALLCLLGGMIFQKIRLLCVIAAFSIMFSSVVATLLVTTLVGWTEEYHLPIRVVGGPLTSASLFGLIINSYLLSARIVFHAQEK